MDKKRLIKMPSHTVFVNKDGHVYSTTQGKETVDLGYILQAPSNNLITFEEELEKKQIDITRLKEVCDDQQTLTAMATVTQCTAYREAVALAGLVQRMKWKPLSSSAKPLKSISSCLAEELDFLSGIKVIVKEIDNLYSRIEKRNITKTSFQNQIRHIVGEIVHLVNP